MSLVVALQGVEDDLEWILGMWLGFISEVFVAVFAVIFLYDALTGMSKSSFGGMFV